MTDKHRMVMVTGEELVTLQADQPNIGVPILTKMTGVYWADADELRLWRSQHTSGVTNERG